jgi:hypothetical protein
MIAKDGIRSAVAVLYLTLSAEGNVHTSLEETHRADDDALNGLQQVDTLWNECKEHS